MVSLYVIQTDILQWATLGQNKLQSLLGFMLIVKCLGTWYLVLFPTYFPFLFVLHNVFIYICDMFAYMNKSVLYVSQLWALALV